MTYEALWAALQRKRIVSNLLIRPQLPSSSTQCLKITEKVSFNIASEASYIYILSGQKFIKKVKNGQFLGEFLNNWSLRSNSVTRQVNFIMT